MGNVDELRIFREMGAIEESADLWSFVVETLQQRGAQAVIYHCYAGVASWNCGARGIRVLAADVPTSWLQNYIGNKDFMVDPLAEFARVTGRPFFWSEVDAQMRMSPRQQACLEAQRAAGLVDGVGMHVFGPELSGAYFGCSFDSAEKRVSDADIMEWQSIIQMAHLHGSALRIRNKARALDLAPREREILHWIARGKSNSVIARILGISPHTIDTLVRRVFEKLQVADRTSAAIKGVGSGQVLLD